eukprot:4116161-Prymnesium_polylepis.1
MMGLSTLLWTDQPGVGDDGAFKATDTGSRGAACNRPIVIAINSHQAIMMAIMQRRHTLVKVGVIQPNVIIHLSIHELSARHSYR